MKCYYLLLSLIQEYELSVKLSLKVISSQLLLIIKDESF